MQHGLAGAKVRFPIAVSNGEFVASVTNLGYWAGRSGWSEGTPAYLGFYSILPPNGPSCSQGTGDYSAGLFTASSYHSGGVNMVLCDGSVRFVSDTINAGDPSKNTPMLNSPPGGESPYGVWGALGSIAGGESVSF